ncbi:DUF4349 domain-containing protein [Streptomyces sp. NPDC090025]|uniref:DUF4349 domain-containing protein n=1 Tax=Streptomyces sp. NPDC090025 TaxID=3365922 RepID=UPI00383637CA
MRTDSTDGTDGTDRRAAPRRTRTAATAGAVLLTASLLLTGCAGGGAQDSSASGADAKDRASQAGTGYGGPEAADGAAKDSGSGSSNAGGTNGTNGTSGAPKPGGTAQPAAQHVIRTAELSVEVKDAAKATAAARRTAVAAGGHVENETTERVAEDRVSSRIVLRVPQERYDAVLAELAGAGRLLSRTADAKDVTGQVVDVDSRIATQRASVARVRALMDRATRLSDVVTLEGELSRRQADLESLLAQQAALKDRTTLATITLQLSEPEPAAVAGGTDRPGFLDALRGGWEALLAAGAWVLVVLAALFPWLVAAAAGFALWRFVVRPRLPRRSRAKARAGAGTGPVDGAEPGRTELPS